MKRHYHLSVTTQGPLYPPSEVMDEDGNFIVIGTVNGVNDSGGVVMEWGGAIVSPASDLPAFGECFPYDILERFNPDSVPDHLNDKVLHTLPLPLPCNNYGMTFAPDQYPLANLEERGSIPFHLTPIPDAEWCHGRQMRSPVTLGDWVGAQGKLVVSLENDDREARFTFIFSGLVPKSLYTIMTLRENDLKPGVQSRPGPLGIPNVFVTDGHGNGHFEALLPDPFPPLSRSGNRVINVVVLFMSYQMSHGGAIGRYGLGGDIHAQLKLPQRAFDEFQTKPFERQEFNSQVEIAKYHRNFSQDRSVYAFFDVDETLIRTKSMFDFYKFYCMYRSAVRDLELFEEHFADMRARSMPREELNRAYYRYFAGVDPEELGRIGQLWWKKVSKRPDLFIKESCDFLKFLKDSGVEVVFVSGSFKEILSPLAGELGVAQLLCAPMQIDPKGFYNGNLSAPPTIGAGKAEAIRQFLQIKGGDASVCWAIGDDLSDVPMLELVGNPVAVGDRTPLGLFAAERDWRVLHGHPSPSDFQSLSQKQDSPPRELPTCGNSSPKLSGKGMS